MAHAIDLTLDGGYLIGGFTTAFGAVGKDYFVVKIDSAGNQQWAKRFGGNGDDVIRIVKATSDGKYVVAGFTHSFGVAGDIMVIQLDSDGNIEWQKRYGGGGFDELSSARLTDDGGFLTVGETRSFNAVTEDYWAVKFSGDGVLEWAKRYGGSGVDEAEAVVLAPEGGFVAVGTTRSFGAQGEDVWTLKADADGNVGQCAPDVRANLDTPAHTFNTTAVPVNTAVTVGSHVVTVTNSNPTVISSNANISMQCEALSANEPPLARRNFYTTNINTVECTGAGGTCE